MHPLTSLGSPCSIEIWLMRQPGEVEWTVNSTRVKLDRHSRRILFDEPTSTQFAFSGSVHALLDAHLNQCFETSVFSNKNFHLEVGELRLRGLRVLTRIAPDGAASATVRFMSADGPFQLFLAPAYRTKDIAVSQVADLTAPAISELLFPALQIFDEIVANGCTEENAELLRARLRTLKMRRDELSDYLGLLSSVSLEKPRYHNGDVELLESEDNRAQIHHSRRTNHLDASWSAGGGFERQLTSDVLWDHHNRQA